MAFPMQVQPSKPPPARVARAGLRRSVADSALPPAVASEIGVLGSPGMAMRTVRVRPTARCPAVVFGNRYRLKMAWIDTRPGTAQMIDVPALRDRAYQVLIDPAVRERPASELPVSVGLQPPAPEPTRPEVRGVHRDGAILVDGRPEPLLV